MKRTLEIEDRLPLAIRAIRVGFPQREVAEDYLGVSYRTWMRLRTTHPALRAAMAERRAAGL